MTDLHARLAEIRELQGLDPMPDPGKIQGLGEGAPPPPPFPERPPVDLSQVPEEPAEYIDDEEPEYSPLIPQPTAPAPEPRFTRPDLAVASNDAGASIASYLGREVLLTEKEATAVRTVVLRALERQFLAQAAEVRALRPQRKRRSRVAKDKRENSEVAPPSAAPPKRRGRPRKVQA